MNILVSGFTANLFRSIHLLSFRNKRFLYFMKNNRFLEINHLTAFILGQIGQRNKTINSRSKIRLNCGRYSPSLIRKACHDLSAPLNALIGEIDRYHNKTSPNSRSELAKITVRKLKYLRSRETERKYYVYLTRTCNLDCKYCWNQRGALQETAPPPLTKNKIDKLWNFIFRDSRHQKIVEISLFGGEPLLLDIGLLKYFFSYYKRFAKKAGGKVSIIINTNGTVWSAEIAKLCKTYNCAFAVSLDGSRKQHDAFRVSRTGRPTHKMIINNLKKIKKVVPAYMISLNATLGDPGFDWLEAYEEMAKIGVKSVFIKYFSTSAYEGRKNSAKTLPLSSMTEYKRQVNRKVDALLQNIRSTSPEKFLSIMYGLASKYAFPEIYCSTCKFGFGKIVIQTDGKLYPCLIVSSDKYCLGDVEKGVTNWELIKRDRFRFVDRHSSCKKCWLRYSCGGPCPALSLSCEGNANKPVRLECERKKYDISSDVYLISQINKIRPDYLQDLAKKIEPHKKIAVF